MCPLEAIFDQANDPIASLWRLFYVNISGWFYIHIPYVYIDIATEMKLCRFN